jgi:Zn-dependent peptidase ImmA (M78 family)
VSDLDELAKRVLIDAGISTEPPIDVSLLARRLGLEVRHERLNGTAGMLKIDGDRPVVVVERRSHRTRARFTIAHEIGHYVLASYTSEVADIWAVRPSLRDPERFCDRYAESLLMPADWFRKELRSGRPTLQRLIWAATQTEVSVSAASVRVTRVTAWRLTLLRLARTSQKWGLMSVTGLLRPGWRQLLEINRDTAMQLDEIDGTAASAPLWLSLSLEGEACYAPAQLVAWDTSAIAWVNLLARRPKPGPEPASKSLAC